MSVTHFTCFNGVKTLLAAFELGIIVINTNSRQQPAINKVKVFYICAANKYCSTVVFLKKEKKKVGPGHLAKKGESSKAGK